MMLPPTRSWNSPAHHRRGLGLPALTINWGVLGGEGYVARNERVAEFLAKQGTSGTLATRSDGVNGIIPQGRHNAGDGDPCPYGPSGDSFSAACKEKPLFKRASQPSEGQETGSAKNDYRLKIETAAPEDLEDIIGQAVRDAVGSALRVKPESLRYDQPLADLGLDSLMGVEIETRWRPLWAWRWHRLA